MSKEKLATLTNAIENKLLVKFNYDKCQRLVEPHLLGETNKGNLILKAYQIAGAVKRGKVPCWGSFTIGKIKELELVETSFLKRPSLNIEAEIEKLFSTTLCSITE
jgi:hypothetical protein